MTELTFDRPAEDWLEALPLGNGRLGAMCYGGTGLARFDLNDEAAWSGSPASEAAQARPDASTAAVLLERARHLIAAERFTDAEAPLKAMQSAYTQSYLPFASVSLRIIDQGEPVDYRRSLNLATATHEVRYRLGDAELVQSTIVSVRRGVLVHIIEGERIGDVAVEVSTPLHIIDDLSGDRDRVMLLRLPSDVAPAHETRFPPAQWSKRPGESVQGALAVRVHRETIADGRQRVVVFATTETTFTGLGAPLAGTAATAAARALTRIDAAVALGADALSAEHRREHGSLFSRVSLRIDDGNGHARASGVGAALTTGDRLTRAFSRPHPLSHDPGLAAVLFDYGRYLLLSSSRPGGLPATLQGIWNHSMQPPWSSNFTMNINLQMNYWQSNVVNLPETAQPLLDFVVELASAGRSTAKRLYGARGWVAHHNSDAWLYTSPVGAQAGDPSWAFWPMAGPWLIRQIWDGVEFGMIGPDDLRERLWPVIRGAAEFGLDWLILMPDGSWGTAPSTSPENSFIAPDGAASGVTNSTAMDLSLLRDLFEITVAAAERIGVVTDGVVGEVRERLAAVAEAPAIGADGRVLEWCRDVPEADEHHRHLSPLYFVYPGRGICDAEHRDAAVRTLERRGDASTGWSLVWKLALWARLGRPDKVSDLLRLFFAPASATRGPWAGGLYPNLFAAHPPFQIDGNLGYVAALAEALLQSHAGAIDLLPALPAELAAGEVTGLVARPGVLVDIRWRDGVLETATLRARGPGGAGPARIRYRQHTIERDLRADRAVEVAAADFGDHSQEESDA